MGDGQNSLTIGSNVSSNHFKSVPLDSDPNYSKNGSGLGLFEAQALAGGAKLSGLHGIKKWLYISYYELKKHYLKYPLNYLRI